MKHPLPADVVARLTPSLSWSIAVLLSSLGQGRHPDPSGFNSVNVPLLTTTLEVLIGIELRLTLDASRSASFPALAGCTSSLIPEGIRATGRGPVAKTVLAPSPHGSNVQTCTGKAKHILSHKITGFAHSILRRTAATAAILDAGNIIADSV
ncbi:hypothetical protein B0H13DRAFT_1887775 [Mycena leptocephala]|nr:hypothetical protein B0H13DRAFT_1887775 [Mycena leptocephala]